MRQMRMIKELIKITSAGGCIFSVFAASLRKLVDKKYRASIADAAVKNDLNF